jgi:hypothetical protein
LITLATFGQHREKSFENSSSTWNDSSCAAALPLPPAPPRPLPKAMRGSLATR